MKVDENLLSELHYARRTVAGIRRSGGAGLSSAIARLHEVEAKIEHHLESQMTPDGREALRRVIGVHADCVKYRPEDEQHG